MCKNIHNEYTWNMKKYIVREWKVAHQAWLRNDTGSTNENRLQTKEQVQQKSSVMERVLDYWMSVIHTAQPAYRVQSDGKMKGNQ